MDAWLAVTWLTPLIVATALCAAHDVHGPRDKSDDAVVSQTATVTIQVGGMKKTRSGAT